MVAACAYWLQVWAAVAKLCKVCCSISKGTVAIAQLRESLHSKADVPVLLAFYTTLCPELESCSKVVQVSHSL